jgi:hypothetical protein
LHETNGYLGGYLVTNQWGRPLEFRLSTAVQPNRVQQILYGGTLQPYICADLIGKTLVEKTGVPVQLIVTDTEAVLDLRLRLEVPIVYYMPSEPKKDPASVDSSENCSAIRIAQGSIWCHARFPQDVAVVRELLDRLDGGLELGEPFLRIREAIGEARKLGVAARMTG